MGFSPKFRDEVIAIGKASRFRQSDYLIEIKDNVPPGVRGTFRGILKEIASTIFAAIRRASSLLSNLAGDRRLGSLSQ
jgi:hypothetical protein